MKMITDWFRHQFNNPQVVFLTLFLVLLFVVVVLMGNMLAPLLAAVVIAYLLEGLVGVLEKTRLPRLIAVLVVYFAFLLFVVLILFGLLPLLSQQATQFVQQIPSMLNVGQDVLLKPELSRDRLGRADWRNHGDHPHRTHLLGAETAVRLSRVGDGPHYHPDLPHPDANPDFLHDEGQRSAGRLGGPLCTE